MQLYCICICCPQSVPTKMTDTNFEAIIVGGSYAGLSAAMALGRSLRKTLVIDSGNPCNKQTPHSHNFLTQDGKTPEEIAVLARQQVEQYKTISFHQGTALSGRRTETGFEIKTEEGDTFVGEKLVFATGVKDIMPAIKGFTECWGTSVIHCPYCHGYEYQGQKTGILANGDWAYHLASLVNNLTKDLTIITSGKSDFNGDQLSTLETNGIYIMQNEIAEIVHQAGQIQHVILDNGKKLMLEALYAAIPFKQHSDIPVSLGCELTESGHIKVDHFYKTSIQGVFACGDNATPFRSVANAVASGNSTGALVNMELVEENF